jgi:hypothetical protein
LPLRLWHRKFTVSLMETVINSSRTCIC